ncbi:hypothetical protein [Helicobacter labacensis]|uniref:hypothetical protein n=1 Tax=Helicobacter labacensis TaxID=2316079 RepID=UPI000EAC38B2|nr:hypothetical protein [Helicobacter labacensis]
MILSKIQFLNGLQCPKILWLEEHKSEVLSAPNVEEKRILRQNMEVRMAARNLFVSGKEVVSEQDKNAQVLHTQKLIQQGESVLYEATFKYQNLLAHVDILEIMRNESGTIVGMVIHGITKHTSICAQNGHPALKTYLWDLAVQFYVLAGLGYSIHDVCLICLNENYMRCGALDFTQLFLKSHWLDAITQLQTKIPQLLEEMSKVIASPTEPKIDI